MAGFRVDLEVAFWSGCGACADADGSGEEDFISFGHIELPGTGADVNLHCGRVAWLLGWRALASKEETIFRAASMYLLAQYYLNREQRGADFEFEGLTRIYENLQTVNVTIAHRLRAATRTDSSINAIVLLDSYAQALPLAIEQSLEKMRYLFSPFLLPKEMAQSSGNKVQCY